jgi:hypothetical protein
MIRIVALLAPAVCLSVLASSGLGQCLEWSDAFDVPGANWKVRDSVVFDDGTGPALYACGVFTEIDGEWMQHVAKWDGTSWSEVGGGIGGYTVRALEVFDDGTGPKLYAAGRFPGALDHLAVLKAGFFKKVATTQPNDGVHALAVHDDGSGPALYLGGAFTKVGQLTARRIARWDGSNWSALGGGFTGDVDTLEVHDAGNGPELYAGGAFNTGFSGKVLNHTARWNGSNWSALAGGTDLNVNVFQSWDDGNGPALYAGGWFTSVSGVGAVGYIAKWSGSSWSALGTGLDGRVDALEVFDDGSGARLVAGGAFTTAGGVNSPGTAAWDGSSWASEARVPGDVYTLTQYDLGGGPELFVGGDFFVAESRVSNHLGSWDGANWTAYGNGLGLSDRIHAFETYDDGSGPSLYASGMFDNAGPRVVNHIARWTGTSWEPLGAGLSNRAIDMAVYTDGRTGPGLVAVGGFTTAGGAPANRVAMWKNGSWSSMGPGLDDTVNAVAVLEIGELESLYAGGLFTTPHNYISRWDGAQWKSVGGGTDGPVNTMLLWDDGNGTALYVGGYFANAGGMPASAIAKWDGASWSPLGAGMSLATTGVQVDALVAHDDGSGPALYAAGAFRMAGNVTAHRIARWDGTAWSAVGQVGLDSRALALGTYDGGLGGSALFVGGKFKYADGVPAQFIASWDGAVWTGLGGMTGEVTDFAVVDDGGWPELWVGGAFFHAGGTSATGTRSFRVAKYSNPCACQGATYCTAGTTASGCQASITSVGDASRSSASGFQVTVTGVEGDKNGLLYFGTLGAQSNPWGNGSSYQCVVPPTQRAGTQSAGGTAGACDGAFSIDFNTWMTGAPQNAPQPGDTAYMQAWFRDPQNTSSQSTSLSNGLRFGVCP